MKRNRLGYPCVNRTIGALADRTFRLASYSDERLLDTARSNLEALERLIVFNDVHDLRFVRVSSQTVPFASHPVCRVDWLEPLRPLLDRIGALIRRADMRVSMHPDQFVLINSPDERIVRAGLSELEYHDRLLTAMGLGWDTKIQIHVGGVYGDTASAIDRFIDRFEALPPGVRSRLVIENDERLFGVMDCLQISSRTGIPILFDTFHHELKGDGMSTREAFDACRSTWSEPDGAPMIDYSSQMPGGRFGEHAGAIDLAHFERMMDRLSGEHFDMILEIKDKEKSALKALPVLQRTRPRKMSGGVPSR